MRGPIWGDGLVGDAVLVQDEDGDVFLVRRLRAFVYEAQGEDKSCNVALYTSADFGRPFVICTPHTRSFTGRRPGASPAAHSAEQLSDTE